jgi:diguanylate cyclase (GGDEF)-like protein
LAWVLPPIDPFLPQGWTIMKANTAVVALLSTLSLWLSLPKRSDRQLLASRLLGAAVALIAAAVLVEYVFHITIGLDTWLSPDRGAVQPGRLSPQTATSFALLSVVLIFIRLRKRFAAYIVDGFAFSAALMVLVIASGYLFGASGLFGVSATTRTAPQTMVLLVLLTFVAFGRRAEYGFFSTLLGVGIGGKIARLVGPLTLLMPFMLEIGRDSLFEAKLMSKQYSTALRTSLVSMLGFGLVIVLARRIDILEREIRDLSLRDELTQLYNRRGFYVNAERAVLSARRARVPFSVLFIDLDNLKKVNDTLGHEAGSDFLCEVAELLKKSFRASDVIARIGGDEFVVAGEEGIRLGALRLEAAVASRNTEVGHAYPLSFSIGSVTSEGSGLESLEDLLSQADGAMYITKRDKKLARR